MIRTGIEIDPDTFGEVAAIVADYHHDLPALKKDLEAVRVRRSAQEIKILLEGKIIDRAEARMLSGLPATPLLPHGQVAVSSDLMYEIAHVLTGVDDRMAAHALQAIGL